MKIITDLHIHSRYSRACSKSLTLENIDTWCAFKGINVVSTADFTHPAWFSHLQEELKESENGLYIRKKNSKGTQFIFGTEISCIYSKGGKVRRIHMLVFVPDIASVKKAIRYLDTIGNLKADGRPILGLDVKELVKRVMDIHEDAYCIPAHAWTPWFAVFGSKSGFDTLEECFEEEMKHIFAIETGLSSDPKMNRKLSSLDNITMISNSDAHSLPKLGREANVFELQNVSYKNIRNVIKNGDPKQFLYTIEFFPEEGKYHLDGHANCNISFEPLDSKKHKNICPQCGKDLVIGVLNRVDKLSDRKKEKMDGKIPYRSIIPLQEIISEALGKGVQTKTVQEEYKKIIQNIGNEFYVLLDAPLNDMKQHTHETIIEGIKRVREGKVIITPGYDGVYGKINLFKNDEIIGKIQEKLL